jgi:integrase
MTLDQSATGGATHEETFAIELVWDADQDATAVRAKNVQPDSLVCSTWSGKPISPNNILRRWVFPACDTLGMKRATWLTFRRTYSSWAHEKGVPGKVVAQLMGHAKVDTTLNVYTQVIDGALRVTVDKLGSELFTIVHKPETGAELTHL